MVVIYPVKIHEQKEMVLMWSRWMANHVFTEAAMVLPYGVLI